MSYIRDPIYVWGSCHGLSCSENIDMKESLHKDVWYHKYKDEGGDNIDELAFKHMAEHYRKMAGNPETDNDAMLIYYHAWSRYISLFPILGWLIRRLEWRFSEKYGFEEEE